MIASLNFAVKVNPSCTFKYIDNNIHMCRPEEIIITKLFSQACFCSEVILLFTTILNDAQAERITDLVQWEAIFQDFL